MLVVRSEERRSAPSMRVGVTLRTAARALAAATRIDQSWLSVPKKSDRKEHTFANLNQIIRKNRSKILGKESVCLARKVFLCKTDRGQAAPMVVSAAAFTASACCSFSLAASG